MARPGWGQGGGETGRGNRQGLTSLQESLLPLRLGRGLEPGVPSLLPSQLLGQEVDLLFQSGLGQALPWGW